MNGVEILKTIPIEEVSFTLCFSIPMFIALVGLIISYCLIVKTQEKKAFVVWFSSLLIAIIVAMLMATSPWFSKPTGEYKYEVQTTEECKINEFKNTYEILEEKDNNIYIVKEK